MSEYTVLCVDTDDAIDEMRTAVAANDQLTPVGRTSVEGALDALDAESVDCVVTDDDLPDGDGPTVIEAARDQTPPTPCVLFTASDPTTIETSTFEAVGIEYVDRESSAAVDRLGFLVEDIITHNAQAGFLVPEDEQSRLDALAEYDVDSLPVEESFARLTGLIASHFDVDVAFIGLIDRTTEQFVACTGADWESMDREDTICTHSMLQKEVMVVEDITEDARFQNNEALHELGIVSYAGANMNTPEGKTIGQLCVIGHTPRAYSEAERDDLEAFADLAMELLELRDRVEGTTSDGVRQ